MAQKFSFLITLDKNGNPVGKAYQRTDAQTAVDEYNKARDAGKEAYLFQHPNPDKRCKSEAARNATAEATKPTHDAPAVDTPVDLNK
jgi:hypothetical protein